MSASIPHRRRAPAFLALLAALAAAPGVPAQFHVTASTASDSLLAGDPVRDEDLVVRHVNGSTWVHAPAETAAALLEPVGANGSHGVFGDVDAVHDDGAWPIQDGLYLSLVSDEDGFLDGDVLRGGATGFTLFLAEADFIAAAGATDGNVDVDAFHLDPDGRVLFSFAEDEASSFLSGDSPGVLSDGDILVWLPGAGSADVLHLESEIDAFVSQALGSSTTTGEVKSVSRDPGTGDVLFTVQSPTPHDASVFSTAGGGTLVLDEAAWAFGASTEFDALSVSPRTWPGLTTTVADPAAGATGSLELRGAAPSSAHVVLLSGSLGPAQVVLSGWGGLVLGADALFAASLELAPFRTVVTDALGRASIPFTIPAGAVAVDLYVQTAGVASPHPASNPIVLDVAQ